VLHAAHILDLNEKEEAIEDNKVYLRILTPLIKLFTAKECMRVVSEGVECFGGLGYLEDSGIP